MHKLFHPRLTARPCNIVGEPLPPQSEPPPREVPPNDDWTLFKSQSTFLLSDFLYCRVEMSASNIDFLMEVWAFEVMKHGLTSPFTSHEHVYKTIDKIRVGDIPWKCLSMNYTGTGADENSPSWQKESYHIWYRDPDHVVKVMLENPDFADQFDYTPYHLTDSDGKRRWTNFMSGNYAWRQSDKIFAEDPSTEGSMYCGIILGSNKTTVSVATGQVEYHPLYLSIGNPHNAVRRAHRNTVIPITFLAIPKAERKYDNDPAFRKFKRHLYHCSISAILQSLKAGMTTPVIRQCPDSHYRRVIYDLAVYIADYPEQVLLAGIVQNWCPKCTALPEDLDGSEGGRRTRTLDNLLCSTLVSNELWDEYGIDDDVVPFTNDFPRANIHEMLSPDLLHQIIKGAFNDHLVSWTCSYILSIHGEARGNEILNDIDKRIAATPHFPGLRRFPQGRWFKQWTGDDSKALMKVFIPAIAEYVPVRVTQCLSALLDFCYIVRHSELGERDIADAEAALHKFHTNREAFRDSGIRPTGFSLPRQHSLTHYLYMIQEFGAPNRLCSSITELRHITAVKRPWRHSNRYEALRQMLLTIQWLDKLAGARVEFVDRGMLPPSHAIPAVVPRHATHHIDEGCDHDEHGLEQEAVDGDKVDGSLELAKRAQRRYPQQLNALALHIGQPRLPVLVHDFLFHQLDQVNPALSDNEIMTRMEQLLRFDGPISVFHSACAMFYAPSDISGIHGMRREWIRSTPSWRKKHHQHDCVFIVVDQSQPGMRGMVIGQVKLFFSLVCDGITYPCALVDRFACVGRIPDPVTGLWKVRPDRDRSGRQVQSIEHLDAIYRGAHLIPVFGDGFLPPDFHFSYSLDVFDTYYVNKYADHHANEIVF
ncbi:hypothetical protein PAXINDRAFT_83109 [Paxillus involutus ATCC 200175]|uniref:Uncharacterized protein n=1 Tax=Paxillus involutus ATCC 200175 TaxID=664439 RepID=A0A0C9TP86_PAXIN|nr:hypothetical protein PAXINDRAFT_83109 [Paxillus involutus ATCC 200175]